MMTNFSRIYHGFSNIFFCLCLLLSVLLATEISAVAQIASGTNPIDRLSAKDWLEDLHFTVKEMEAQHKSLFHTMTRTEFDRFVRKFEADIPQMNEDQIIVRFAQLGALVQDGHIGLLVGESFDPGPATHIPVRFVQYPDGIYVRAAAQEYADAVGGPRRSIRRHRRC